MLKSLPNTSLTFYHEVLLLAFSPFNSAALPRFAYSLSIVLELARIHYIWSQNIIVTKIAKRRAKKTETTPNTTLLIYWNM